jgi:hypothetical protein
MFVDESMTTENECCCHAAKVWRERCYREELRTDAALKEAERLRAALTVLYRKCYQHGDVGAEMEQSRAALAPQPAAPALKEEKEEAMTIQEKLAERREMLARMKDGPWQTRLDNINIMRDEYGRLLALVEALAAEVYHLRNYDPFFGQCDEKCEHAGASNAALAAWLANGKEKKQGTDLAAWLADGKEKQRNRR